MVLCNSMSWHMSLALFCTFLLCHCSVDMQESKVTVSVLIAMLTCDICGEEIMFEEDMRTHLLLSHLENDMHCPLCSLSGVSYNELCFHISSAHPDEQDQAHLTLPSGCSAETNAAVMESVDGQTATQLPLTQSCTAGDTCDGAGSVTPTGASSVTTDSVPHKLNITAESGGSSPGETLPTTSILRTQGAKTRLKSNVLCDEGYIGMKSEHSKAKQKRLSSRRKGDSTFSNFMAALHGFFFQLIPIR